MRFLLSLWLSAFAASALAQETKSPPLPPWVQFTVVDVRPGMVDEFLAVQKELTELSKKDKMPWRRVSRTEVFGDTYRFLIATPLEKLGSFDRQAPPDAARTALRHRVERCIDGRKSYALRLLPDIGNPLPSDQEPDLMVVSVASIAPGREQDYVDVMAKDFLPHFDEANVHHVTGSIAFGGESGFVHVFYVRSFAELDQGSPVLRALGAEGARAVTEKLAGIVSKSELWVARVLPEVSYGPAPSESSRR